MEKDSDHENWSKGGEFAHCKHDDCHYFLRNHGKKRRQLAIMYPEKVVYKCDSCKQKSTFKYKKQKDTKAKVDDAPIPPLKSLIEQWDKSE